MEGDAASVETTGSEPAGWAMTPAVAWLAVRDGADGYWPQRVAALRNAAPGKGAGVARLAHWCLPSRRQQAGRFSSAVATKAARSGANSMRLKNSNSELEIARRKNSILAEFTSPATVALRLVENRPSNSTIRQNRARERPLC